MTFSTKLGGESGNRTLWPHFWSLLISSQLPYHPAHSPNFSLLQFWSSVWGSNPSRRRERTLISPEIERKENVHWAGKEVRTLDILIGNQVLYQTELYLLNEHLQNLVYKIGFEPMCFLQNGVTAHRLQPLGHSYMILHFLSYCQPTKSYNWYIRRDSNSRPRGESPSVLVARRRIYNFPLTT